MLRSVNATRLALLPTLLVLATGPACRKEQEPAGREIPSGTVADVAPAARPADGGPATAAADAEVLREESARFMPEPYENLWIGEPLPEFLAGHVHARPYVAKADPERLRWHELQEPNGLIIRLGFSDGATPAERFLRSAQFMSLLQAPVGPNAPTTVQTVEAWRQWMMRAYAPHLAALRDKYGEKADVYSCAGGSEHPIVRIVWRGRMLAVTIAFMMHDEGLSSTLMVTPLDTAERYIRATQCRWIQDRVL